MSLMGFLLVAAVQVKRPEFREETIETQSGGVGYNSVIMDVNGDGKPDLVLVTQKKDQVLWYENPSWKKHLLIGDPVTLPEPIAELKVGGDPRAHLLVGGRFILNNTTDPCPLWLLRHPREAGAAWEPVKIDEEPSLHRLTSLTLGGKKELVVACLMGRGSQAPDWSGPGAPLYVLRPGVDPFRDPWTREMISDGLHRLHGVVAMDREGGGDQLLLAAAFEGIHVFDRTPAGWKAIEVIGQPPGASEIKSFRLPGGSRALAAIEPWHGDQVAIYVGAPHARERRVILEGYHVGHGLVPVDFTGQGFDSLVVGFRGVKGQGGHAVVLLHPRDERGEHWDQEVIDDRDMETDALHAVDLRGNGRIDLVATGKGSNVKIYWNGGK